MRLLYVCSDFGITPSGTKGAAIHLRAITRALAERGHEVLLLSPKEGPRPQGALAPQSRVGTAHPTIPSQPQSGSATDHPVRRLLPPGCPETDRSRHAALLPARSLRRWLQAHDLDDAVARDLRPLLWNTWVVDKVLAELETRDGAAPRSATADRSAATQSPCIDKVALRPEVVIERLSLFSYVGLDLAAALKVPLIVEVNAPLTAEASRYRDLSLKPLAIEIERRVLHGADGIVVVSHVLADRLVSDGADPAKIHVVPNGIDPRLFPAHAVCSSQSSVVSSQSSVVSRQSSAAGHQASERAARRAQLGLQRNATAPGDDPHEAGPFVVGFVGSLKPWHGVDLLIDAFAELARRDPTVRLLIVGSGKLEASLKDVVRRLGLDNQVIFHGAVAHDEIPGLLEVMDVGVAPFRPVNPERLTADFYFSPIKLFEYMAAGLCVIASRLGQIAEVIRDDVNGMLMRPNDVTHLASLLSKARNSPSLRARLGAQARQTVLDRYTWAHAADATIEVINEALRRRRRQTASRSPGVSHPPSAISEVGAVTQPLSRIEGSK